MGQVTDRLDLGHARTALEGVHVRCKDDSGATFCGSQPALQGLAGAFEDIHGLFEEDRNDLVDQLTFLCRSEPARDQRRVYPAITRHR